MNKNDLLTVAIGDRVGDMVVTDITESNLVCCECSVGHRCKITILIAERRKVNCRYCADAIRVARGETTRKTQGKTYIVWNSMIQRCKSGRANSKSYGDKGIRVCVGWLTYDGFVREMGLCPDGYSLERRNVEQGYSPDNCLWIPRSRQAYNTSRTRWVLYEGTVMPFADALRLSGLSAYKLDKVLATTTVL